MFTRNEKNIVKHFTSENAFELAESLRGGIAIKKVLSSLLIRINLAV